MDRNKTLENLFLLELWDALEDGRISAQRAKKIQNIIKKARIIIFSSKNNLSSMITSFLFSLGIKKIKNISLTERKFENIIGDYDLVICCSEATLAPAYLQLNQACLKKEIPLIGAELDTHQVVIGPTVLPGKSACYNCYRLRLKENEQFKKQDYILKAENFNPLWDIRILEPSVANHLSLEAIKVLTEIKPPMLVNRLLTLTSLDAHGRFDELIRKTTCTHCGINYTTDRNKIFPAAHKKAITLVDRESIYNENGLRITSSEQTLKKMEKLIGKVGVITEVRKWGIDKVFPCFHIVSADPNGNNECGDHFGKGVTLEQSRASGLGEAIERYCAKLHGDEKSITASFKEVKKDVLDPETLVLPLNFPIKYSEDLKIDWSWGYSLTNNKPVLVPSEAVYLPYQSRTGGQKILVCDSNGLAAGNCLEEAILHGIIEVVERDAHMIVEQHRLCMPDVDIKKTKNQYIRRVLDTLQEKGITYYIKNLTLDIQVPTFSTFLQHNSKESGEIDAFSYAVGTHLNPELALLRSLTEALQIYPVVPAWLKNNPDYELNYRWHRGPRTVQFESILNLSSTNIKTDIETCIDFIRGLGLEIIVVELTRPYIEFPVVRVIIPGLQPIISPFSIRWSRRLFEVPGLLGYKNYIKEDDSVNKAPKVLGIKLDKDRLFDLPCKIDIHPDDISRPFPEKPKVLSFFDVAFITQDKAVFKSPYRSFALKVEDRDEFKKLIPLLNGKHTISEILQS